MATESTKISENRTITIQSGSHKKASLAASLENKTINEFVSGAIDRVAEPILRKHGMNPAKLDVVGS